jgi:hypothetical protein
MRQHDVNEERERVSMNIARTSPSSKRLVATPPTPRVIDLANVIVSLARVHAPCARNHAPSAPSASV